MLFLILISNQATMVNTNKSGKDADEKGKKAGILTFFKPDKKKQRGRRALRRTKIAQSKVAEDAQLPLVSRGRSKSERRAVKGREEPAKQQSKTK